MDRIGVRELKQNASAVLRRVQAGEMLEVTDRGRPVARLVPIRGSGVLDQLVSEGRVRPPAATLSGLAPPLEPTPGLPLPSEVLAEMRSNER